MTEQPGRRGFVEQNKNLRRLFGIRVDPVAGLLAVIHLDEHVVLRPEPNVQCDSIFNVDDIGV